MNVHDFYNRLFNKKLHPKYPVYPSVFFGWVWSSVSGRPRLGANSSFYLLTPYNGIHTFTIRPVSSPKGKNWGRFRTRAAEAGERTMAAC